MLRAQVGKRTFGSIAGGILLLAGTTTSVIADTPCGELNECRAFIEINASDGDIGFQVLFDAEGWQAAKIFDPAGNQIFTESAEGPLKDQLLTENMFESAEPVCEADLAEDAGDVVVTLPEFLQRFPAGLYQFNVKLESGGELAGMTGLTHYIPAAPIDVEFDGSEISWGYGDDLGACTTVPNGFMVIPEGQLIGYEVVMSPEDEALSKFTFAVRVMVGTNSVTVPEEYLDSLPANTPLKVEVGAIEMRANGSFGNQTFTEEDGFCNNKSQNKCPNGENGVEEPEPRHRRGHHQRRHMRPLSLGEEFLRVFGKGADRR